MPERLAISALVKGPPWLRCAQMADITKAVVLLSVWSNIQGTCLYSLLFFGWVSGVGWVWQIAADEAGVDMKYLLPAP